MSRPDRGSASRGLPRLRRHADADRRPAGGRGDLRRACATPCAGWRSACTVCVVSGRDRRVVQQLMGLDDLIVAGSHGFDIWSPTGGAIQRREGTEFDALLAEVTAQLRSGLALVRGALIEPKRSSVAVHYRLVEEHERPRVKAIVDRTARRPPRGAQGHARQDGLRDPAEGRLGQGQGRAAPARGARARRRRRRAALRRRRHHRRGRVRGDRRPRGSASSWPTRRPGGERERRTAADFVLRDPREVQQLLDLLGGPGGAGRTRLAAASTTASTRPRRGCARR